MKNDRGGGVPADWRRARGMRLLLALAVACGVGIVYPGTASAGDIKTFTLTSSTNPAPPGAAVTFTAHVVGADSWQVTGNVTFYDGATSLGSRPLTVSDATLTTNSLASGTHSISAKYGGDEHYDPWVGPTVSQVITGTSPTQTPTAAPPGLPAPTATPAAAAAVATTDSTPASGTASLPPTSAAAKTTTSSQAIQPQSGSATAPSAVPSLPPGQATFDGTGVGGFIRSLPGPVVIAGISVAAVSLVGTLVFLTTLLLRRRWTARLHEKDVPGLRF